MTVPVQDTFTASTANGVTTVFPYGFKIAAAEDLVVTIDDVIQTIGYTVSGVGSPSGGNVTFDTAPANGAEVIRYLDPVLKRDTDYQQFGDWSAQNVNLDFDRIWLALRSMKQFATRAIKMRVNTTDDQVITEAPADRALKVIGFDALGALKLYIAQAGTSLVDLAASAGASLIGWFQIGTGAQARTVQDKLRGVEISAFDYMTSAQQAQAKAGTLPAAEALAAVQAAVDAVHADGGGLVVVPQGVIMGALSANLNLYPGVSPTAPVMVMDRSRSDHVVFYTGTNDVEYSFMGGRALAGGPNTPIARIHNYSRDGLRNPSLFFTYGQTPDQGSDTELGWVIGGSNDGNAASNVPAHDLVIAGGQGGSYNTGTASVTQGSATVTGVGTAWTSDFVGAIFTMDGQANAAGIVKSVESNTSLTLWSPWGTYGGTTAAGGAYHLQGGKWTGTLTSDYRARLILGQNYTWVFNAGNYSAGMDYSPLHVGNGGGNYAANISYVFNGNRLKGGGINPSTILKMDNATGTAGVIGWVFTGGAYAGTPTKCIYLDKATNTLFFGNALNGAGGFSLNNDGVLGLQSGQLKFPGTQAPSADANTLDDYEEGTFTPTVVGSAPAGTTTYTSQVGRYTKIGNRVTFSLKVEWSNMTGTGVLVFGGLPFTSGASLSPPCAVSSYNLTFTGQLSAYVNPSASTILAIQMSSGAAYSAVAVDTAAIVEISGHYEI